VEGVTVIVSGAGGHGLRTLGTQHHTVVASKTLVATATRLVLRPGQADFSQVDANGTVYDSGSVTCTPPPPPDTTPPETTITRRPADPSGETTATFEFEGSDDQTSLLLLRFECRLDSQQSAAWSACSSPRQYTGLGAGSHTFDVRAFDQAGNVDSTPASFAWTIVVEEPPDTTPPETTITSATTSGMSASFSFVANEPGSTFECSLDGTAFAACTSPKAYSGLAVGGHGFRVRATDGAGNVDATPAEYTWTIGSCTATTVTVGAAADSWLLQSSSSSNFGSDSVLKVDTKAGANARAIVRFNLPAIPAGCGVTSATLRLYASSYKTGRTLQALQLAGAWTEGGVTWSNQPATTGPAATAASGFGYREWAVTAQVQSMYAGAGHGFLIRDAIEGGGGLEQGFHSREKGTDEPPRLVIAFG
jgi:large repetitive protein